MLQEKGKQIKQWSKPQLLVLTRRMPQEAVLADCKGSGSPASMANEYNGCTINQTVPIFVECGINCHDIASS
jgi:hypothetical protein